MVYLVHALIGVYDRVLLRIARRDIEECIANPGVVISAFFLETILLVTPFPGAGQG